MNWKTLTVSLTILYFLPYPMSACDYRALDSEAESYSYRIQSGKKRISSEDIRKDLYFLEDEENVDSKYTSENNFYNLYNDISKKINHRPFLQFTDSCEEAYETTKDKADKVAIFMLLERVNAIFSLYLNQAARIREFINQDRFLDKEIKTINDLLLEQESKHSS